MQNSKKYLKVVAILVGTILGIILIAVIGLYLFVAGKVVDNQYGKISAIEKIWRVSQLAGSDINIHILKNAPACDDVQVKETFYNMMRKSHLADNQTDARIVNVTAGTRQGYRGVVGTLYFLNLNLHDIALEKSDREAKKNMCSATFDYTEQLNENGKMDDDRVIVTTPYSCRVYYETQTTLDNDSFQVGITEYQCKMGDTSVEENDD